MSDAESIKKALELVLLSPEFTKSKRISQFLRFIVESHLADPHLSLSSHDIAIQCFQRSTSNDPNDPYVRNIASQTRKALNNFFRSSTCEAPLEIELPRGKYKPSYSTRQTQATGEKNFEVPQTAIQTFDSTETAWHKPERMAATVAVIPFSCRSGNEEDAVIGQLIADEVSCQLAASRLLTVIAQRSAAKFRNDEKSAREIASLLSADYVLSGSYHVQNNTVRVHASLNNDEDEALLWGTAVSGEVDTLVNMTDSLIDELLMGISRNIMQNEVSRVLSQPLSSLKCHSLLIGGITCMHRASPNEFELAKDMFESLKNRNPRHAAGFAYQARWNLFGLYRDKASSRSSDDIRLTVEQLTAEALDRDSAHPIALAAQGLIKSHFEADMESAQLIYKHALHQAPNEPTALGLLSVARTYSSDPGGAIEAAEEAMRVSPFDPEMYFLETAAAMAAFSNRDYEAAIQYGEQSRLRIPTHTSNLRILAASYYGAGRNDLAEITANYMLQIDPEFSLKKYKRSMPFAQFEPGTRVVDFLEKVGVPR